MSNIENVPNEIDFYLESAITPGLAKLLQYRSSRPYTQVSFFCWNLAFPCDRHRACLPAVDVQIRETESRTVRYCDQKMISDAGVYAGQRQWALQRMGVNDVRLFQFPGAQPRPMSFVMGKWTVDAHHVLVCLSEYKTQSSIHCVRNFTAVFYCGLLAERENGTVSLNLIVGISRRNQLDPRYS